MIPETKISEIKSAARISEFISPYVDLKRSGRNLMGLCPFHSEKSPSFSVSDENGFYHCFGCGEGGSVFKFLMTIENLTFPESVRKVAARYSIDVPESDERGAGRRQGLYEVAASAARYFRKCMLETPAGEPALAYLASRGVSEAASEGFLIGAAPTSGDGLVRWFAREGVSVQDGEQLGLIGTRGGRTYDRFRGRLMFPIRDPQGRVVGFGGRRLGEDDGPKYLNSPDSDIYHKGRILYGLHEVREAARERRETSSADPFLLVEGYLDVIALHEVGLTRAVATCGTALTVDQARAIRRFGREVITVFDGDQAGQVAGARSFPVLIEAGLWPSGAFLPEGDDPDSLVRSGGREALENILRGAEPLAEAYVKHLGAQASGVTDRSRLGRDLSVVLAKVADPFEYDFLVKKAALWTGISESLLRTEAKRAAAAPDRPSRATPGGRAEGPVHAPPERLRAPDRAPGLEELLATLLVADPGGIARVADSGIVEALEEEPWGGVIRTFLAGAEGRPGARPIESTADALDSLGDGARDRVAARLVDDATFADAVTRERMFTDCVAKLAQKVKRLERRRLVNELRRREERGEALEAASELRPWSQRSNSDV